MIRKIFFLSSIFGLTLAGGEDASWMTNWIMPDPGIFIWTVITFLIVLAILKWKAWGPLMQALDDREEKISSALDAASKAKEEAQKVSSDYEEMIAKAESEKQDILSQAKQDADTLREKKEAEADAKCSDMLEKAKKEIDAEKAKALKEIKSVAVNLSVEAASKIISKNLDSDDNRKIAEDTISSIN